MLMKYKHWFTWEIMFMRGNDLVRIEYENSMEMNRGLAAIVIMEDVFCLEYWNSDRDTFETELDRNDETIVCGERIHNLFFSLIRDDSKKVNEKQLFL